MQTTKMSPLRLPFSFARRYGILLLPLEQESDQRSVIYKHGLSPTALVEVRRFIGLPFDCVEVDEETFDSRLAYTYQNDSDEAMQMIEGLGEELDLASLAESVPETEDLLEQEENAPMIRLINSLLTEAAKVDASDIHIEPYETRLVVRFRVDGVLREVVRPKRALAPLLAGWSSRAKR